MGTDADSRMQKMTEIGLARAMASMPRSDEDLLKVAETCRKYLGKDTLAGNGDKPLAVLFNSKAHEEIRVALNVLAAEHARAVLKSEETATGLDADALQFIFGYANLKTQLWNMIDDGAEPVLQSVKRFPELTPARINAVMPDFGRPAFVPPLKGGLSM